jgi:hypothetical protein
MSQKHDSSGGYIGGSPTQNASACPGVHSARYFENRSRTSQRPAGTAITSTYSGGDIGLLTGFSTTLPPLTYNINIVGGGQTIELRRNSDSNLIKSWSITENATSGTDWSISNNSLTLTVPSAATSSLSAGQALTLTVPAKTVKNTEGFQLQNAYTVPGNVSSYGATESTAAGSAKAIQQLNPSAASGNYWIKNVNGSSARQLYCDMSTDGGGWTRWFNQQGVGANAYPSYTRNDLNLNSFNTDNDHYSAATHRKSRADSHSSGGRLDYLFEQTNGNYKYRLRGYFEGDPGVGNRNAANISNISSSHFDFGWFNYSSVGYWPGYLNSTSGYCVSSQHIVHYVGGDNSWNAGYFSLSRGYQSDPGNSENCGDHCGNVRRSWQVTPALAYQENCYSNYSSYSVISNPSTGTMRCYYREVGTLGSGSL